MGAVVVGILLILFAIFTILPFPWSLNWGDEVILFIKGGLPVLSVLIGVISFFVGIADIRDKIEVKREEEKERTEVSGKAFEKNE